MANLAGETFHGDNETVFLDYEALLKHGLRIAVMCSGSWLRPVTDDGLMRAVVPLSPEYRAVFAEFCDRRWTAHNDHARRAGELAGGVVRRGAQWRQPVAGAGTQGPIQLDARQ